MVCGAYCLQVLEGRVSGNAKTASKTKYLYHLAQNITHEKHLRAVQPLVLVKSTCSGYPHT